MSDYDPRNRIDPLNTDPRIGNTDPRFESQSGSGLGLLAVLAALVVAVIIGWSLMGGEPRGPQDAQAPSVTTPGQRTAPDPTTTGSVPRPAPTTPAPAPAPTPPAAPQTAPQ
jgi:hypothetical protein